MHWGDSTKDQMETRDDEVLYITACNPYNNLRFRGLTITKVTIIPKGRGDLGSTTVTPSITIPPVRTGLKTARKEDDTIQLIPDRLIRFGDLCGCACASQALSLLLQNAKPQDYEIVVKYCIEQIEINQDNTGETRFPITLINS